MSPSVSFNEASRIYKKLESDMKEKNLETLTISKNEPYLAPTILPLRIAMEHLRMVPFRQEWGLEKMGIGIGSFNIAYSKYRDFVVKDNCEVDRYELRQFCECLDIFDQKGEKILEGEFLGKWVE